MRYYNELGIEGTATREEIKRAYFRLVRKFSPEKNPEAFMGLRRAYEILSDPERRSAYDASLSRFGDISQEAVNDVMEADELNAKGLTGDAVALLEGKLGGYADAGDVDAANALEIALCKLYLEEEKTGKAVKIAEKLVKENPTNIQRLRLAVKACLARGYTTKARAYMDTLERLDPGGEENHLAFIENNWRHMGPTLVGRMAHSVETKGGKAPLLCAYALSDCFVDGEDDFLHTREEVLQDFMKSLGEEDLPFDDPLFAANKLAEHTEGVSPDKGAIVGKLLTSEILRGMIVNDRYDFLPQIDRVIKNIGKEDLFSSEVYAHVSAGYAALQAVRMGIPKMLAALPLMRLWSQIDRFGAEARALYRDEVLALELDILANYPWIKPHFQRFRDDFGELYRYAADFIEKISRCNENALIDEFNRRYTRAEHIDQRLTLAWLGPEDDFGVGTEPIRVEKIGRNDPCPCGSGKKYKKCCGRGVG